MNRNVQRSSALMRQLGELLVGKWRLDGDAQGQIRFERSDGEYFLVQYVDLRVFGRQVRGIEGPQPAMF